MKSKELKELKTKKKEELMKMAFDKKKEVTLILGRMYVGKEKNLRKAKNLRREVAQIMTIQNLKLKVKKGEEK